jgi:hypothetical protein
VKLHVMMDVRQPNWERLSARAILALGGKKPEVHTLHEGAICASLLDVEAVAFVSSPQTQPMLFLRIRYIWREVCHACLPIEGARGILRTSIPSRGA